MNDSPPHVWVIECKHPYSRDSEWQPMTGVSGGWPDKSYIHRARESARETAKHMFETNQYNHLTSGWVSVRYRAAKYVRES